MNSPIGLIPQMLATLAFSLVLLLLGIVLLAANLIIVQTASQLVGITPVSAETIVLCASILSAAILLSGGFRR